MHLNFKTGKICSEHNRKGKHNGPLSWEIRQHFVAISITLQNDKINMILEYGMKDFNCIKNVHNGEFSNQIYH